jgi:hypothetical protein
LPEFDRKRQQISQKKETLHKQITQLQATPTQRIALSQVADLIEVFCAKIRPEVNKVSFDQKRQLIELVIDRIIVQDNDAEIHYGIPTHPEGPHIPFVNCVQTIEFNFRDAKQQWGLEDLMNVKEKAVTNASISCFSWPVSVMRYCSLSGNKILITASWT